MNEVATQKQNMGNRLLHLISDHPLGAVLAFLGAISSIIALGPALFPWWTSPRPELSYCIYPVRTPIVQSTKSSDVAVTYKGKPIEGNLTIAQIAIWNAGRAPIKAEEILIPITLRMPDGCTIWDVSLSKTNAVNEFRWRVSTNGSEANQLVVEWKILEKNEGALVQIVYAGTPETPIKLEGRVIGQSALKYRERSKPSNSFLGALCLLALMNGLDKLGENLRPRRKVFKVIWLVMILILTAGLLVGIWYTWPFQMNRTPFGF